MKKKENRFLYYNREKMTILIDSNILIEFLKGKEEVVNQFNQFIAHKLPIFISTISVSEPCFAFQSSL